ncbi:MAG TPA: TetR/AcrR family transcriptional regulator [Vicinamibacteria bacterium]
MGKGDQTRRAILERASSLASRLGLEALSIGRLAQELELSKSGLFAHFQSKEALEVQIIEFAAERFVENVVKPGLAEARGEPRIRALFERWLDWSRRGAGKGGCVFVALAAELDDRPGPARDRLARAQRDWLTLLANCFRTGIAEGHFRTSADPDQFAQDLNGIYLALHHARRLLHDAGAEPRARRAFAALLESVRARRRPN